MLTESFPPAPTWTVKDVPELKGKVIVVTGGNSGIGLEVAKVLASRDAKVYITSRDIAKGEAALADVKRDTGREAYLLQLDLSDLDSVEVFVAEYLRMESRLDILYNSAGVMIPPIDALSKQGYDLQFATNVLGHYYLTKLLLPLLITSARTSLDGIVRVITVSSGAHHGHDISYETLRDGPARRKMSPSYLYAQSKFADVVFAKELATRYGDRGVVSISLNPGNIKTPLQRQITGFIKSTVDWMLHPVVPNGIVTHLWAGTAPETAQYNGLYCIPWARLGKPRRDTQDPQVGQQLWQWLDDQVVGRSTI
ncbi:NAD(P)-binding protein [Punctularia strigosozonata HHB-11173 SS5]|uniref:NAD(P)-binding protein n=1 Tax=Punctularia strigosozonata (strain HHB-11173) TaxID=741275 RepID=UPI0004417933|nr:NAD(P)-binding protein [Punctularia strigosozonata HHB-11173 SS5]EIN09257.1 NAD(P)-binding protein [Punctularia strigosozonata HHB-11173 SS5]